MQNLMFLILTFKILGGETAPSLSCDLMHLCHGVPSSSLRDMEAWNTLKGGVDSWNIFPFYLKLLDPLTPMLIRGGAWGGGGQIINGAFYGYYGILLTMPKGNWPAIA